MQLRANGVTVNDCPRMYCKDPTDESHAVVATDEYGDSVVLPFYLRGVTSYLNTEPLSREEYEAHDFPRVELTSQHLKWDPSSTVYEDQENEMLDGQGHITARNTTARGPFMVINTVTTTSCADAADVMVDKNFGDVLKSHVNVSSFECERTISEANTAPSFDSDEPDFLDDLLSNNGDMVSTRRKMVDSATLAERWNIDPAKAKNTIKHTTQRGVRTCLHPALTRRFPTNDRMLRYDRLPHTVFTDTMKAGITSKSGNLHAQAYCTSYSWSRMHPMALKSQAHETLSALFQRDGVPPKIVADGAKEHHKGDFARKCREADCHLVSTLPYSPWMQAAEGCNKHCKQGSARKMLATGSLKGFGITP